MKEAVERTESRFVCDDCGRESHPEDDSSMSEAGIQLANGE
jgi:transposase-like protein